MSTTRIITQRSGIITRAGQRTDARIVRLGLTRSNVGGVSVHGLLGGLDADDHPQYVLHDDISGAIGIVEKTGVGTYGVIKTLYSQGVAPTVNDDSDSDFGVGSTWFTTAPAGYICVDASVGAAVWVRIGGTFTEYATLRAFWAALPGLSPGDAWGIATPKRAGVIDIYGHPCPHPYVSKGGEGVAVNDTNFLKGLVADGDIADIAGTSVLAANGLTISGSFDHVRFPFPIRRPHVLGVAFIMDTYSNANIRIMGSRVASDTNKATIGAQIGSANRIQAFRFDGGSQSFFSFGSTGGYTAWKTAADEAFLYAKLRPPLTAGTVVPGAGLAGFGKYKGLGTAGQPVLSVGSGVGPAAWDWSSISDDECTQIEVVLVSTGTLRVTRIWATEHAGML